MVCELFPLNARRQHYPRLGGIEARMPTTIPVSAQRDRGIRFHAFGFSAHGFQLGPIVGASSPSWHGWLEQPAHRASVYQALRGPSGSLSGSCDRRRVMDRLRSLCNFRGQPMILP